MFARLKSWLGRSKDAEPTPDEVFRRAFALELAKIETQRAKHAAVKPSQAELEARVNDALARKLSA